MRIGRRSTQMNADEKARTNFTPPASVSVWTWPAYACICFYPRLTKERLMPSLRSLVLLLVCGSLATAGDWPGWLGPTRNGVTPEKIAPWKEAPKLLWRMPVGEGHSSPVVVGGRVFLHTRVKDKDEEE